MQELESAVEGKQAADADLTNLAGCQSGASAAIAALTQELKLRFLMVHTVLLLPQLNLTF